MSYHIFHILSRNSPVTPHTWIASRHASLAAKGKDTLAMTDMDSFRHCERSEAIQNSVGYKTAATEFLFRAALITCVSFDFNSYSYLFFRADDFLSSPSDTDKGVSFRAIFTYKDPVRHTLEYKFQSRF